MEVPMFDWLRKLQQKLMLSPREEVDDYKQACDDLVGKYELLLRHISEYMQENQVTLHSLEHHHEAFSAEVSSPFQLNTFALLSIKEELLGITQECENLLGQGQHRLVIYTGYEKTIHQLLHQLGELRKYSQQIEQALEEFEQKLLKMEEILAAQTLWN